MSSKDVPDDEEMRQMTLNTDSPMANFLRKQATAAGKVSESEFVAGYEKELAKAQLVEETKGSSSRAVDRGEASNSESVLNDSAGCGDARLDNIILKFTTLSSEANTEAPSFKVDSSGASIGRSSANGVSVPSDAKLNEMEHALISCEEGRFYLIDRGYECAASLRIGVGSNTHRVWTFEEGCRFSAGNSIFHHSGLDTNGNLLLDILDGPLKGETSVVKKEECATIGRSSDNSIALPDRELSRRHSKISYDESRGKFVVSDVGSTNGTYMQLIGYYAGRYLLNINDHILVGRTGFSVNRFDYGISEEIGHRQTMEDSCAIVQHLNVRALLQSSPTFFPQSFFAVYDGHGGSEASAYLSKTLHVRIADKLKELSPSIKQQQQSSGEEKGQATERLLKEMLKSVFSATDDEFIRTSEFSQHGSTATTALLVGNWLFCANTGDSRTMLCRNFKAMPMTNDHKPSREDEANRIRMAGGFVINNRVMGELAVSRAFGDADFKKGIQSIIEAEGGGAPVGAEGQDWDQPLIVAEPDVEVTELTENDQFLLLACDGLFDVFAAEDIVEFVRSQMSEHGDTQRCCQNLTYEAIRKRNSRDNVSVILIILNRWY